MSCGTIGSSPSAHATRTTLEPMRIAETLAFMFETRFAQHLTRFAAELATLQVDYAECWKGLARNFTGAR